MRCRWKLSFIHLAICFPFVSTGCGPSYMSEDDAIEAEEKEEKEDDGDEGGAVDESASGVEETVSC